MPHSQETDPSQPEPRLPVWRAHPIIAGVMLFCTIAGAVVGYSVLSGDWSATRRIVGGAAGGFGVGLLITGMRMIG